MFSLNRRSVALAIGVVYLGIGALGFVPGQAPVLGLFGASPLLNVLHVAIGLFAIWASQAHAEARSLTTGLVALLALLVGAAFVAPMTAALAINGADTMLHLVSLALVAYTGLAQREIATA